MSHVLGETTTIDGAQVDNGSLLLDTTVADSNFFTTPAVVVRVARAIVSGLPDGFGKGDHVLVAGYKHTHTHMNSVRADRQKDNSKQEGNALLCHPQAPRPTDQSQRW